MVHISMATFVHWLTWTQLYTWYWETKKILCISWIDHARDSLSKHELVKWRPLNLKIYLDSNGDPQFPFLLKIFLETFPTYPEDVTNVRFSATSLRIIAFNYTRLCLNLSMKISFFLYFTPWTTFIPKCLMRMGKLYHAHISPITMKSIINLVCRSSVYGMHKVINTLGTTAVTAKWSFVYIHFCFKSAHCS